MGLQKERYFDSISKQIVDLGQCCSSAGAVFNVDIAAWIRYVVLTRCSGLQPLAARGRAF
jgi:hypothetical protein